MRILILAKIAIYKIKFPARAGCEENNKEICS